MDLTTVASLRRDLPAHPPAVWRPGDAWLAGGTSLFASPQPQVQQLLDLTALRWPALCVSPDGLEIAATCTVAELYRFSRAMPAGWTVGELIRSCCQAFVASFKVWNLATVGGNLCAALPAAPMVSLLAGLGATSTVWHPGGATRQVPVADLVTGDGCTVLTPGELLRSVHVPMPALTGRALARRESLSTHGRSAALLVGLVTADGFTLTVTASTRRPVVLRFPAVPPSLADSLASFPTELYHDDVHGDPRWRQHLTHRLAEQLRAELA